MRQTVLFDETGVHLNYYVNLLLYQKIPQNPTLSGELSSTYTHSNKQIVLNRQVKEFIFVNQC